MIYAVSITLGSVHSHCVKLVGTKRTVIHTALADVFFLVWAPWNLRTFFCDNAKGFPIDPHFCLVSQS